jgi:NAD(P)H dehydrogenase (quinone)
MTSMYGHIEMPAGAVAEGARSVERTGVVIKRVAELIPIELDIARFQGAHVASIAAKLA